jgi:alcohol dehydrogenase class IV
MRFEFATATRIVFGPGTLREAGGLARALGARALVVTGRNPHRAAGLLSTLESAGVGAAVFSIPGEPRTDDVTNGVQRAREHQCDLVIGFGGGSAIDAAKAIAALLTNPGELLDYLEVIGQAKPLTHRAAPIIAIPTTAGTGAEVTRNAVLASPPHRVKVSLRSPLMLPALAVVDPELTLALPPEVTASTGMDALTQLIEPFVSARANPLTDAICREGLRRVARSLKRAFEHGDDRDAREDMALASLFGGLALANAALGAVHGFAGPLGGMFPAPHGAVCAALLAAVMDMNVRALRRRAPTSPALARYEEVARLLTGNDRASASDGVLWVRHLIAALRIPRLGAYGVKPEDVPALCEKAAAASSMKGNSIALDPIELNEILARAR